MGARLVMTGLLVLAADVEISPAARLSAGLRRRLGARHGEYAITRPRGRAPAKLVTGAGATLLAEFREAQPVVEVVRRLAARDGGDAARLLDEAFPLLRDCFNARFLVAAGSPEAARILPSRERGDTIGPFEVLRCLRVVEDSELYQVRGSAGVAAVKLVRRNAPAGISASLAREAAVLDLLGGKGAPRFIARGRHRRRPWLAMTWCDGIAVEVASAELRERGAAGRRRLAALAVRVARAYARLHRAGLLHGDVHPGNLLVSRRGGPSLVDFGLARAIPGRGGALSGRASVGGVPAYFAPEQAAALLTGRGLPVPTEKSEQYAVAVLLYRLIAGAFPFSAVAERGELLRLVTNEPPRPFARAGAAPWPAVEEVLARALAKKPAKRYPDLRAFVHALSTAAREIPQAPLPKGRDPLAGAVESFVERVAIGSPAFAATGPAPTCSLMLGRAGTALTLLRIASARDDAHVLALADAWLTRAEADAGNADAFESPADGLTLDELGAASPFHSMAGVHVVRALLSLALGDERGMVGAIARFLAASRAPVAGIDLTMGRAGTLLAATRLLEAIPARQSMACAALRTFGDATQAEIWRALETCESGERAAMPGGAGTAHGIGGILSATLGWCTARGGPLPRAFRRRLAALAGAAEPLGRGVRWAQSETDAAPSIWASHDVAGWCNGPAGLLSLWVAAHARWGRPKHLALAEGCGWNAWEAEAEAADLCCGRTGRAYALLSLYRHTGRSEWLDRARGLAVSARAAFEREGQRVTRPLSLFKGVAGLAVLAADLERPESAALALVSPDEMEHPL